MRPLAVMSLLFVFALPPVAPVLAGPVDGSEEAYLAAARMEAETVRLMLQVYRQARVVDEHVARQRDRIHGADMLGKTEKATNSALRDAYRLASLDTAPQQQRLLVRTALLHWMVALRRRSMAPLHTVVPGLDRDAVCAGDIIGEQLFLRYFDTLFLDPTLGQSRTAAVTALGDLARQATCIGTRQSSVLAKDLYESFQEVTSFLRMGGLDHVTVAMAQAAAAPLLLFFDVEKHRLLGAPLGRWFVEHRGVLIEGAVTRRLPASWQGLWLYDRRTGTLVGHRVTATPEGERDIDAASLFESIVRAENLGDGSCGLYDMVRRGQGRNGYVCRGTICVQRPDAALSGAVSDLIRANACGTDATNGNGGLSNAACGGAASTSTGLPPTLTCMADLRMTSDQLFMRCITEASGRCDSPVESLTKHLEAASFTGVPLGGCALQAGGEDPPGTLYDANGVPLFPLVDYDAEVTKAQAALDAITKPTISASEVARRDREAINRYKEQSDKLQNARDNLNYWKAQRNDAARRTQDSKNGLSNSGRCAEDSAECRTNGCSAMAESMRRTMACVDKWSADKATEPPVGVPGSGLINPGPDSVIATDLSRCLAEVADAEGMVTSATCWAIRCGPGMAVALSGNQCGCIETGPSLAIGAQRDAMLCNGTLDCGPDARQDGCRCVTTDADGVLPPTMDAVPRPRIPFGHLEPPTPPTFSLVRPPR